MSKTIEERAMDLINSNTYVGVEGMVEITNPYTIDAMTGEPIDGGLFEEYAFGTSWREICKDYHGEDEWMPHFSEEEVLSFGNGGYIKLAVPLKWCDVTGKSAKSNPLCLDTIGVLPPVMRPIINNSDGKYVCHPINELYTNAIEVNNRIRKLLDANAPKIIIEAETYMLLESVQKLYALLNDLIATSTDGAKLAVYNTMEVTNVCNTVEDIRAEVTSRLDIHDELLAKGKYEEARHHVIDALSIMNKAHWRGVDITDLKEELMRAIGDNLTLNELLGIDVNACE